MKLTISLLTFLIIIAAKAQNELDTTRLTIIGTIHTGSKHIDQKTLLRVLKEIKPDIILSEQDEEYNRVFGLLAANFLKIWNPSIEQLALQKYTRWDKNCIVLPFDILIEDRKAYSSDLRRNQAALFDALYRKRSGGFMSENDSTEYTKYIRIRSSYYNEIMDTTLAGINRKGIVDQTREIYNLDNALIRQLAKEYIPNKRLVEWFDREVVFWEKRNAFMVKQILGYAELNKGKTIVVLTGLNHKYFLLDKISEVNKDIEIFEFFE